MYAYFISVHYKEPMFILQFVSNLRKSIDKQMGGEYKHRVFKDADALAAAKDTSPWYVISYTSYIPLLELIRYVNFI